MPSVQAAAINRILKAMKIPEAEERDYAAERARNSQQNVPKLPKNVSLEILSINGIEVERLTKPGNSKGWIFYIHGGGFTTGSSRERRMLCQYLVDRFGYNCISINYRLAPENKWPAMIEDCFSVYQGYLTLGMRPEETVLMGESAGGTLVLSLALCIQQKGLDQPRAVAAFSPCVNQAGHYPSHFNNISTDHMLRDAVAKGLQGPVFSADASHEVFEDPLASPINGDYAKIAPIFISASDTEVLLDDALMLYAKLVKEGHRTELDLKHDVCHAFQMFPFLPEAQDTLKKVFRFVEES